MPLLLASIGAARPLLLGGHRHHSVGAHLGHAAPGRLRLEIGDELVEIDVVPECGKQMCIMRGKAGLMCSSGSAKAAPLPAVCSASRYLQELDHHVVELDEAHVQTLRAASKIRNAHARAD